MPPSHLAVFSWGSAFVPTKLPSMANIEVEMIVFQSYVVVSVLVSTLFILCWEKFVFAPYGFLGAALWIPANMCGIAACRIIGVGVAQSCWAGGIVIVSFLWGSLGTRIWADHGCTLRSAPLAVLGICTLIAGIAGLAFASSTSRPVAARRREDETALVPTGGREAADTETDGETAPAAACGAGAELPPGGAEAASGPTRAQFLRGLLLTGGTGERRAACI